MKAVRLLDADAPEAASYGVSQKLTVNARAAGPRLGKDVQTAIKGSKSGDWSVAEDGTVTAGGLALEEGEYTLETVAGSADGGSATGMLPGGGFVVLDTEVTPELAAEGLARDLVRAVQQARRDAGLDVSDRIALTIGGSRRRAGRRPHPRGADRRRDPRDVVRRDGRRRRGHARSPSATTRRRRCWSPAPDRPTRRCAPTITSTRRQLTTGRRRSEALGEPVEVGERPRPSRLSGTPQISSVTPASPQATRSSGSGLTAIRTCDLGGAGAAGVRPGLAQRVDLAGDVAARSAWSSSRRRSRRSRRTSSGRRRRR